MKWFVGALCALLLWLGGVATLIALGPPGDSSNSADVAIVLGAAVEGDTPTPVFEGRIEHAVQLYFGGAVDGLIFTGARSPEDTLSEAVAARDFAVARGVKPSDIFIEERSRTTHQNLIEAQKVMQSNGHRSALIVSDPLHLWRAQQMADDLGLDAVASKSAYSRYRSWSTKAPFLLREVYFIHHYWLTGE